MTRIKRLASLVIALSVVCNAQGTAAKDPEIGIGKPAPDFTLTDSTGTPHTLSEYAGKFVVLEWVNPECHYVMKHYNGRSMQTLQRQARADGAVWLSINSAGRGRQGDFSGKGLASWMTNVGWSGDAYFRDQTGRVGKLYRASATPHMYIISKTGTLLYAGAIDNVPTDRISDLKFAVNFVKQAFDEIKAAKPISKPLTRAYGCAMQYGN